MPPVLHVVLSRNILTKSASENAIEQNELISCNLDNDRANQAIHLQPDFDEPSAHSEIRRQEIHDLTKLKVAIMRHSLSKIPWLQIKALAALGKLAR
jgi:hypothetical protein